MPASAAMPLPAPSSLTSLEYVQTSAAIILISLAWPGAVLWLVRDNEPGDKGSMLVKAAAVGSLALVVVAIWLGAQGYSLFLVVGLVLPYALGTLCAIAVVTGLIILLRAAGTLDSSSLAE
jgi:hypothetical protein